VAVVTSLAGQKVLITGGTGSLGKALVRRLLSGRHGELDRITVLSRDETKQYALRLEITQLGAATDDISYRRAHKLLDFRIGDVRNEAAVRDAVRGQNVIVNAAAMKQVPTCEYFPHEAALTNVIGAEHIVRAVRDVGTKSVHTVVGVSTDKACEPVNVMGMTKALQERIFGCANLRSEGARFVVVRYGNVLASRGSVIPLFREQILSGGPLTITNPCMTRFWLSLDNAVDLILAAASSALPGETWIPRPPAAKIIDLARAMIGERCIDLVTVGVRPGEKVHESLISGEEGGRTRLVSPTRIVSDCYYAIAPILPELKNPIHNGPVLGRSYTSNDDLMDIAGVSALLERQRLRVEDDPCAS
jgi:FlaA1/EpsC-like NDP-sugar epimerase